MHLCVQKVRTEAWTDEDVYVCVCVCPNQFSLCHLEAPSSTSSSGIFVLACSEGLKRSREEKKKSPQKFAGDTRTESAYLTQNEKSVAVLTSIWVHPLRLLEQMFPFSSQSTASTDWPRRSQSSAVPWPPRLRLITALSAFSSDFKRSR